MITASLTNLVVFLPFALLLAFILYRSGKAERRVIVEELADEVGRGVTPRNTRRSQRTARSARAASIRARRGSRRRSSTPRTSSRFANAG